jgi:hypothetical protein
MLQSMFVMGMGKEDHVRVNQWLQQHAETILEPVKNDSQALNQVVQVCFCARLACLARGTVHCCLRMPAAYAVAIQQNCIET